MFDKQHINIHIERVLLLLKAQRLFALIPVLFVNVINPAINTAIYLKYGAGDELNSSINQILPIFIPFFSCWWVIFCLKFFYEDKGAEILYVCSDKTKITDLALLFSFMIFGIVLSLIPYFFVVEDFIILFVKLILICVFYFGLSYFVTTAFKSITPTLLTVITYILLNIISPFSKTTFPFYYSPDFPTNIFACEIPLAFSGIILTAIGIYIIKHRQNNL